MSNGICFIAVRPLRRFFSLRVRRAFILGVVSIAISVALHAQAAPGAQVQAEAPTEALRPTLSHISEVAVALNVARWKAPGEVRSVTQRDIDSIQHDVTATLPPLLDQAKTSPVSVTSSFAVYRNVDALYDVLLRVSETAALAAPQSEAASMQEALGSLEGARRSLGDAISQMAATHEQELLSLRAAATQTAAAAAPAPVKTTVIDDGPTTPAKPKTVKRKKKPAVTPTPPPAAQ
jgi:hypothetical protein